MNRHQWAALIGALVLAGVVGVLAYNAGVAHGAEGPHPPYGWYGHGHGFFLIPLFFIAFWLLVSRRRGYGCGRGPERFDEWHRQAHERMKDA